MTAPERDVVILAACELGAELGRQVNGKPRDVALLAVAYVLGGIMAELDDDDVEDMLVKFSERAVASRQAWIEATRDDA